MNDDLHVEDRLAELARVTAEDKSVERAVAATQAAVLNASESQPTIMRRLLMHPSRTIAAAALIVASLVTLAVWISATSNTAYADMLAQIEQVKTVQYLETRTSYDPARDLHGPTEVVKVTILGRSRQRREVVSALPGDPLPDGEMWSQPVVGSVVISDCANGKYVSLDLKAKTFGVIQGFFSISPDDGSISETAPAPAPEVDFYKRIREFPAETAERLPPRETDGKRVIGFRTTEEVKRKAGADNWERTYWVDTQTRLPVRVEVDFTSTVPSRGHSKWVLSDLIFDEPIDETLLSTEPPPGFRDLRERDNTE